MKTIREVFKRNLAELRGKRTIKEVSAGAHIPYRTLQNMEEGVIPQDETLRKISDFYSVPQARLFREEPPPTVSALTEVIKDQEKRLVPDRLQEVVDILAPLDDEKLELATRRIKTYVAGLQAPDTQANTIKPGKNTG